MQRLDQQSIFWDLASEGMSIPRRVIPGASTLSYPLENHVARDFKNHSAHKHQLVTQIDGTLIYGNVLCEAACQCTSEIHAVKLENEKAEKEHDQDRNVDPVKTVNSRKRRG